jgi:hypothetical protein
MFYKKKILYVEEAPMHVLTLWIFNTKISYMPFLLSIIVKKLPCM